MVIMGLVFTTSFSSFAEMTPNLVIDEHSNVPIEVAKGRLFVGMTKIEAYEAKGVPYRVKRLEGEDGKEMWIYRCNNEDGFDEDCLYLYFNGDELDKIERP
jgi:hypothetical protein